MKVRVLGCSGAIAQGCRTTSFLLDHDLLVDAGTGVGDLTLEEMRGIDHVVLTHAHLDHVAALPLMVDAVASARSKPLLVYGLKETIAALRTHIFNDLIWPDFSQIPSVEAPWVRFQEISVEQVLELGGKKVEVLPAVHTVPAVAYAISRDQACWVFSGDTERNPAFWRRVNQMKVSMLVIETAFSRREEDLAVLSRHLSPQTLAEELACIETLHPYPIYITHTKPAETDLIMREVQDMDHLHRRSDGTGEHDIRWLKAGQEFVL